MKHILTLAALVLATSCFGQVPDYVPADGLVAWYPLDGGGLDGTGLGEEAIIHGGEWVIDRFGLENGAIRLDGVDDYVEIPSSGQINFGDSQSFTVALWWSPDAVVSHGGFNGIVNKSFPSGSSQMQGWQLGSSDDDQWFNLQVTGGTEDPASGMSCGFIETYQEPLLPQLMILEFDRESLMIRFELDGDLLTEVACDALTQSFDNDHPLTLGVEREGLYHSSGRFEDLSLWNRLLSIEEKQALQISGPWLSGCTDEGACNFDPEANVNDGSCLDCSLFEERCGPGTVWDESIQLCIVANPSDSNFDGCVSMTDLLDLLSVFGTCNETAWSCGDPLEHHGYDYATVQIGGQCWFAENCRYLPAVSPSSNGSEIDGNAHAYVFEYEGQDIQEAHALENYESYGVLYNRIAMQTWDVCPAGWHIPTDSNISGQGEFWELIAQFVETEVAVELKSDFSSTPGWNGSNNSGFDALPAGYRRVHSTQGYGFFGGLGAETQYWAVETWSRRLTTTDPDLSFMGTSEHWGLSVRCIQDPE